VAALYARSAFNDAAEVDNLCWTYGRYLGELAKLGGSAFA
jgi:hypothetical protein